MAEKLGLKKPVRLPFQIVLDSEFADNFAEAQQAQQLAKIRFDAMPTDAHRASELRTAQKQLDDLKTKIEGSIVTIHVQNISPLEWERLVDENGITEEQQERLRRQGHSDTPSWNVETFPPIVISKCAVFVDDNGNTEPLWSLEQVKAMFDDPRWSTGDLMGMFELAVRANSARKVVNLGNG